MHKGCETNSCKQNIFVNLVDIGSFLPLGLKAQRGIAIMVSGVGRSVGRRSSVGRRRARCQLSRTFSFNFLATILKFLMNVPYHKAHPCIAFGDDPTNGRACMHAHAFSVGTRFFSQFLSYGSEILIGSVSP